MEAKHLVYFCKGIESVFDSQVLELIKSLEERKIFREVILFLGIRNEEEMAELSERVIPKEIRVITYKTYPNYIFFNPLIRWQLRKVIKENLPVIKNSIIHVREELIAWHVAKILGAEYSPRILPDIRGATIEEILENNKLTAVKKYIKIWNYRCALKYLNNFNRISAVSKVLRQYLISEFGVKNEKIAVTPDLAGKHFKYDNRQRTIIRDEMKLSRDDILLLFSNGSTSQWQNWQNNDILKLLADKGIKILNLSRYNIDHINIINKFAKYDEVPLYLNAADVAIIWSNRRLVTQVRSPVKFSEYICCGLPVIANDSVDMITEYVKKTNYGIILDNIDQLDLNTLKTLASADRNKIAYYGQRWVGLKNITDSYIRVYSSMCAYKARHAYSILNAHQDPIITK